MVYMAYTFLKVCKIYLVWMLLSFTANDGVIDTVVNNINEVLR